MGFYSRIILTPLFSPFLKYQLLKRKDIFVSRCIVKKLGLLSINDLWGQYFALKEKTKRGKCLGRRRVYNPQTKGCESFQWKAEGG